MNERIIKQFNMKIFNNIAISESGFIFNPISGDSFSTNSVGLEILKLLKEEITKNELTNSIIERYAIEKSTVERDLEDFIMILEYHQLLEDNE